MRCESVLIRLDPWRTGELEARERKVIQSHLAGCSSCHDELEKITRFAEAAPALMGACPTSFTEDLIRQLVDGYDKIHVSGVEVWVAFSREGITTVALATKSLEELTLEYEKRFRRDLRRRALPEAFADEIVEAWQGAGGKRPDVDLSRLAGFERRVLETLLTIPKGEVRSYAWVAREAGKPAATRAVGTACARNPVPFVVPCHRVVPSTGGVGAYAYGSEMKRGLLSREGVDVVQIDRLKKKHARYVVSPDGKEYCFPTCRAARRIKPEDLELIRDEREAAARGLTPCDWCRPLAQAA